MDGLSPENGQPAYEARHRLKEAADQQTVEPDWRDQIDGKRVDMLSADSKGGLVQSLREADALLLDHAETQREYAGGLLKNLDAAVTSATIIGDPDLEKALRYERTTARNNYLQLLPREKQEEPQPNRLTGDQFGFVAPKASEPAPPSTGSQSE